MAFGITPKYTHNLPLGDLTPQQFLVIAVEAVKKLGWEISTVSETGFVAFTKFSMSSWSELVDVKIENGNASLRSECTGNQMTDWGKNEANINNLLEAIDEQKKSFTPEELSKKYEELKTTITPKEENLQSQPETTKDKFTDFLSLFKPREGYYITPILVNLNIAIFIVMVASGVSIIAPDGATIAAWGANFRPLIMEGQWWRLVTCCFIHIGILHLLMNMYALIYIGLLLEPYLGKARFTAAYLLTGITASIASLWWHDLTISAGASGAIFGMYGVFVSMLTTNLIEKVKRKTLLASIGIFVAYNLLNGMKGGIDNAAHLGGLIGGLIIGYAFVPSLKKNEATKLKYSTIWLLTAFVLFTSFIIYENTPCDIAQYDMEMKSFSSMEAKALGVYKLKVGDSKEVMLHTIKDTAIYYWNEIIKMVSNLDKLNLPDPAHEKDRKLLDYCNFRIKCYNFMYKDVEQDTNLYVDSVVFYNQKIQEVMNELKAN